MLYPAGLETKLGFDQIRLLLKENCLSPLGKNFVDKIRFSHDSEQIQKMLRQTDEFKRLLEQNLPFPQDNYLDLTSYLDSLKPEGSFLSGEEFKNLTIVLRTISGCKDCLNKYSVEFPELYDLQSTVAIDERIYYKITSIVDTFGKVKDKASPDLEEIRQHLYYELQTLRKETDKLLRYYKKENFIDELLEPTIRNGRTVLPIKSEFKRKIKGLIHDESATGQTTFIEPAEIFEINNNIKDLELLEKREVNRILLQLSNYIREQIPEIKKAFTFLGIVDFIRAKALFAIETKSVLPELTKERKIEWLDARHPLLYLNFKKNNKQIVPLSLELNSKQRILIISGPNAGGKSVCLKTTGLLQYMAQSGLLISANEGSSCGIFKDIFIDIGDEQSIENDLSTYSAHLSAMHHFIKMCSKDSLILIDEFGAGTEPSIGESIATAILKELNTTQCFGIITTHFTQIKALAAEEPGLINGAMAFHLEKMEPLYTLRIGNPGSSFALEIASKIGLPKKILDQAAENVGTSQLRLDELIRNLEKEKTQLLEDMSRLESKEKQARERVETYTRLHSELLEKKKVWMNEAKKEAQEIIQEANKKIEQIIREIKENNADKESTRKLRKSLDEFKEQLTEEVQSNPPEAESEDIDLKTIKIGDYVRVRESGAFATVQSIKEKEAEISIGDLKSIVKLNRLVKITKKEFKENMGLGFISKDDKNALEKNKIIFEKIKDFSPNIDVRGKRGEETVKIVQDFLDNAILAGAREIKIVHGKGDGILRKLIRETLKANKIVQSVQDEHADRGGDGATIIRLNF